MPAIEALGRRRRDAHGDRGHRLHRLHARATPTARSPTWSAGSTPPPATTEWSYVPLPDELLRRRPGRHPQRDHLPERRRPAGRRPGRPGRRGRLVQRPRADRADVRQGRRRLHGRRQPLQVQERAAPSTGDNADTGDGQGAWNGDRVRQAESLAAFADELRGVDRRRRRRRCMGDFNAYTQEDPIDDAARRPASPTSGSSSTRAGTATCSTTCRARSTTRWPRRR